MNLVAPSWKAAGIGAPLLLLTLSLLVSACEIRSERDSDAEATRVRLAQEERPNIIFIMADDLGYGQLGSYGQQKIRTPALDRMADEGTRFMQFYAGAAVCAPSRSVLMTGMHGGHTSVRGNSGGIPLVDEDITVAEVLQRAGYTTGIFGKWGLGDAETSGIPRRQGFDEFFGYLHQVHAHFYYPYYLWHNEEKYLLPGNEGQRRQQYTHDEIMEKALDFTRRAAATDAPFFLYLPFTIPHTELLVPHDSFEEYEGEFPEPEPYVDQRNHYADQPAPRTTIAGMITRMDRDVGRLFDQLSELGIDEETIVFFTSDNGASMSSIEFFESNGPLRGGKADHYEGGIRVPLIVRWPMRIEAGRVDEEHVWYFADVMPTLVELAGAEGPDSIDGLSFVPAILGEDAAGRPQREHEYLYWELEHGGTLMRAARMGRWKALRADDDVSLELYDLAEDAGEDHDVVDEYPDVAARMNALLDTVRTSPREYPDEPPTWGLPRTETGYVR